MRWLITKLYELITRGGRLTTSDDYNYYMEVKKTWFEKLMELSEEECLPLGKTHKQSVYSAINLNRDEIERRGLKFRVQADKNKKYFVCRVKKI